MVDVELSKLVGSTAVSTSEKGPKLAVESLTTDKYYQCVLHNYRCNSRVFLGFTDRSSGWSVLDVVSRFLAIVRQRR